MDETVKKPEKRMQTSSIAPAFILDCIRHHFLKCTPVPHRKERRLLIKRSDSQKYSLFFGK